MSTSTFTPTPNSSSSAFAPLQNDTFLRACLRQATEHTPVWLMRQAGRYLPEYRDTRAQAGSFMGLATNTQYATDVTLQPLDRYPLDAAILFSDILTVPDAMGLGLSFALGEGPKFAKNVRNEAAVAELAVPDMAKLRYVFDAVTSIRKALNGRVPLIGFSGSPWTLACYMVEGAGSDDYRHVKTLMYSRPDLMHRILAVNADAVALYLNTQIEAGAQAVMVFDSWGGVLADGAFQQFSLAYTARVLAQLKTHHDGVRIPSIVFTKGGGLWLPEMAGLNCKATSTPTSCLPRPSTLRPRCAACSTALARPTPMRAPPDPHTSLTWATASASSRRQSMFRLWSRPCTAIRAICVPRLTNKHRTPFSQLRNIKKQVETLFFGKKRGFKCLTYAQK